MANPAASPKQNSNQGLVIALILCLSVLLILLGALGLQQMEGEGKLFSFGEPKPVDPEWMRTPAPGYVKLEAFTTNLPGNTASRFQYIQMAVDLKTESAERADQLKAFMPELKSNVLRAVIARSGNELASLEGKDRLAEAITATANQVAGTRQDKAPFAGAFFTTFLMQ